MKQPGSHREYCRAILRYEKVVSICFGHKKTVLALWLKRSWGLMPDFGRNCPSFNRSALPQVPAFMRRRMVFARQRELSGPGGVPSTLLAGRSVRSIVVRPLTTGESSHLPSCHSDTGALAGEFVIPEGKMGREI